MEMKCGYGLFYECPNKMGCISCMINEINKYRELEQHREKMKAREKEHERSEWCQTLDGNCIQCKFDNDCNLKGEGK